MHVLSVDSIAFTKTWLNEGLNLSHFKNECEHV